MLCLGPVGRTGTARGSYGRETCGELFKPSERSLNGQAVEMVVNV